MKETVVPSDKCASLAGQVFGSWTVLAHVAGAEHAKAQCACGALQTITARDLRGGKTRRCAGCRQAAADAKLPQPGQRVGSWTVLELGPRGSGRKAFCRCDCGAEKAVSVQHLIRGVSSRCSRCRVADMPTLALKHGLRGSSTYTCWKNMLQRCCNPKNKRWDNYGGRGIEVCERWLSFEAFLEDMGEKPCPELTLERYDVNRGYGPGNCGWEPKEVQPHNKTTTVWVEHEGTRVSLGTKCRLLGVRANTVYDRHHRGWEVDRLFDGLLEGAP